MAARKDLPEKELRKMYIKEKKSIIMLADYFGVGTGTIWNNMKRYEIPTRGRYYRTPYRTPEIVDFVVGAKSSGLSPEWIVGFVDGEGSFQIVISKRCNQERLTCYPRFSVAQKDMDILNKLNTFFMIGSVNNGEHYSRCSYYVVGGYRGCRVIKRFFEEYPPMVKNKQFNFWCKIIEYAEKKDFHLSQEDILQVKNWREEMKRR